MMPFREKEKYVLKCIKCGYQTDVPPEQVKTYRIGYEVEEEKRVVAAKATKGVRRALTPEEREMLQEYYEVFLESFETEEAGGEAE